MIGRTNINGTNDASGVGAILSIDAPTGSTVTVSQGSFSKVLRDSIEISELYSRYFYLVTPSRFGSWTITATRSVKSDSKTITVNSNSLYDVFLSYLLDLYTPGDVHTDVTGGWSATTGGSYVQFGSESINFTNAGYFPIISTDGTIPLSGYSTLFIDINVNSYGSSGNIFAGIADSRITADNQFAARVRKTTTGRETISLDISAYADSKYVAIAGYHSNANIYRVWLRT